MRTTTFALVAGILFSALSFGYSGGDGTSGNPYQIATTADLLQLAATTADYGKSFILTADIDMVGRLFFSAVIAPDTNESTDTFEGTTFSGVFDGNGHTISHFTIFGNKRFMGLFGCIDAAGHVRSLGVENAQVSGLIIVGVLAGVNIGTISDCYTTGSVTAFSCAGGLAGGSVNSVARCFSTASVSGTDRIGGLIGRTLGGNISQCYSTGAVSGTTLTAGFIGDYNTSVLNANFWDVETSGQSDGLGNIDPDLNTIGLTTALMMTVSNFTGAGWDFSGEDGDAADWKMCGYPKLAWGMVDCYSGGDGTSGNPYQIATKGDLLQLAATTAHYSKSFILTADIDMAGQSFTMAIIAADTSTSVGFQGTLFAGNFDGNNHRIMNFNINGTGKDCVGLFGRTSAASHIRNLGLETFTITGRYDIGGLVGSNAGRITDCYSTGTVTSSRGGVGGITGNNEGTGLIGCCFSTGPITGEGDVGGLVGANDGVITDCYSRGAVIGESNTGGLVGWNHYAEIHPSAISKSYSTGLVTCPVLGGGLVGRADGPVTACFWDQDTSGKVTSGGGTGKTTLEMKTLGTFSGAGWDFSVADGDSAEWYMPVSDYPGLQFEQQAFVPDIVGMLQANARSTILAAGLSVGTISAEYSSSIPIDEVINQQPAAGTEVSGNSAVNFMVSLGASTTVPDVVGLPQANAQSAITAVDLVVGTVTQRYDVVPEGCVISQSIPAGTLIAVNTAINLVVSLGPTVVIPDLSGLSQAEAQSTITSLQLTVGTITTVFDNSVPQGNVISQSPIAGSQVNFGSAVDLIISLGAPIAVPDLTGMSQTGARSAITSAGLIAGTLTTAYDFSIQPGNIAGQSPAAGVQVSAGSTVNMVMSVGPEAVTIPVLAGLAQTEAESAIVSAGLACGSINSAYDSSIPAGHVISQSPPAGIRTGVGSSVNVVISLGAGTDVPDVEGLAQAEAEAAITAAGLVVGTVTTSYDYGTAAGCVANQSPIGGTEAQAGTAVNLIVSLGRGGNGTAGNPYAIAGKNGLLAVSAATSDYNKCFVLTADIDLAGSIFANAVIAPDTNASSGGFQGAAFTGIFDGNDHQIKHLTINVSNNDYIGLFGKVGSAGHITSLLLNNVLITSTGYSENVGGLVGYNEGTIDHCSVTGTIKSYERVGGLVGTNIKNISECYAKVTINGAAFVGGLVGSNEVPDEYSVNAVITDSYAIGSVTGTQLVGGLVGQNAGCIVVQDWSGFPPEVVYFIEAEITDSFARCSVQGNSAIGGLAGANFEGRISYCYAEGVVNGAAAEGVGGLTGSNAQGSIGRSFSSADVAGSSYVGGLTGENSALYRKSEITNCYASGSVSGITYVGGIVGESFGDYDPDWGITTGAFSIRSFSYGLVQGSSNVGGFAGSASHSAFSACLWDTETSGQLTSAGGTGKTTIEMTTESTYTSAGYDFSDSDGDAADWMMYLYPKLAWENVQSYSGGYGTLTDPYQISNVDDLLDLSARSSNWGSCFILTNDIDLAGHTFTKAVIAPDTNNSTSTFEGTMFDGLFNGNGHTISNLVITSGTAYHVGLFGYIAASGQVIDLGVENAHVSGYSIVGILVGRNDGSILDCYATGSVSAFSRAGGFAGGSINSVARCFSTASVSGTDGIGGLMGRTYGGTVSQCYSAGAVSGTSLTAGFIGDYNTSILSANFWDVETSGQTDGLGNIDPDLNTTGLTTAQMMTVSNFTGAGWDFIADDGDAADWMMLREAEDYPRLAWQEIIPGDIAGLYGVNEEDFAEIAANWLLTDCPENCQDADLDGSGDVGLPDIVLFAEWWMH